MPQVGINSSADVENMTAVVAANDFSCSWMDMVRRRFKRAISVMGGMLRSLSCGEVTRKLLIAGISEFPNSFEHLKVSPCPSET